MERSILEPESEEAEFLVTRYDPETGDVLPVEKRVGALDRKLRVVCENTEREEDWIEWALYALESVYGYAFAGDAALIFRCLLLLSFADWYEAVWHKRASKRLLQDAATKIAWNFWQMDPETGRVPYGHPESRIEQLSLFENAILPAGAAPKCRIHYGKSRTPILFEEMGKEVEQAQVGCRSR